MYCDIPIFKRCCFCLPLRPGLIAYGYIKMIMMILFGAYAWYIEMRFPVMVVVMTVTTIDVVASCVFIVGGHFKKTVLLKIFMYYTIVVLLIYVSLMIAMIAIHIRAIRLSYLYTVAIKTALDVVVQVYVVFLVRSEVYKLQNPVDDAVEYKTGYTRVVVGQPLKV